MTHYGPPPPPPEANGLGRYMAQIAGELMARMHHAEISHAEHRAEAREHWAESRAAMQEMRDRQTAVEVRVELLSDKGESHHGLMDELQGLAKHAGTALRWLTALVLAIGYVLGKTDLAALKSIAGLGGGGH